MESWLAVSFLLPALAVVACAGDAGTHAVSPTPSATPEPSDTAVATPAPEEDAGPPPEPDAQGQCPEGYENVNDQCLRKRGIRLTN